MNIESVVLYIVLPAYLILGFLYAVYVVLVGGGSIFSIPINMVLGPAYVPLNILYAFLTFRRKKKIPRNLPGIDYTEFDALEKEAKAKKSAK